MKSRWSSHSLIAPQAAASNSPPARQAIGPGRGLPVAQPEKIRNNPEFRAQLEAIQPDAIVVVAYGRIIPLWMLALPRLGCINLHGSCCPSTAGPRPSNGPWPWATPSLATPPCCLKKAWTPARFLLQQTIEISPGQTAVDSSRFSPIPAHLWWLKRLPAGQRSLQPSRRTTPSPPLPRFSIAKTAAWTLPRAPPRVCTTAGAAFNPGRALSPPSTARS